MDETFAFNSSTVIPYFIAREISISNSEPSEARMIALNSLDISSMILAFSFCKVCLY